MSALSAVHTTPSSNEQQLITAVRRGDDRAFEELYARYRSRISSYVLGMVGDHQRAEDVAQEVFIAALRRLRATERPIAFKPWIYEIAKNACIDDFRRSKRAREISLDVDEEAETPPARLISHGADTAVEHKQRLDDLRGAFGGLSEAHHRVIVMRELEGRSYSQIGASLGMSKPVVESTLFRARRKLSEEYEELVTGRRCERVQTVITADGEKPLRRLGIKERRLLARHLAHCQPCRRHARMAGVDDSFFKTPSIAAKIAALFPLPFLRLRRGHGGGATSASPGRSVSAVQSLQSAAAYVEPSAPADGLSRAAAAVAAIVVAGAGGGLVSGITNHNQMPRPRIVHTAPARATTHSSGSAAPAAAARAAHTIAVPPTVWGSSGSSASSSASHQARRRERTTGSGGGSGQSGTKHAASTAGGSSGSGATSKATSGSSGVPSASTVTSGAGSALQNPVSAAAGAASRLLGGASSGSGSSGSSGSGIQLPRIGPVQLPKISLPSGSSSTSTTPSSSSSPLPVPLPKIPGAPDPNKLIQGLTGH